MSHSKPASTAEPKDAVVLTPDPLDFTALINCSRDPKAGAISAFMGTTRDSFQGREVLSLEYEAYLPMADKMLREIMAEARHCWAVHHVTIGHKLGHCPVGEVSVVIVVSAAHRHESLAAVEYLINRLKDCVPIWKKEILGDGTGQWKENEPSRELRSDISPQVPSED
ncbi:molybdopterin synthase catalytic subunit-like protein [Dimargaris cristalligena]|uniref:Molybdopterin synthase catalytic subunit-like protein n=1 Tax=Dimargaris cristalligena TaxID=215637 RepID=A0A4P9ZXN1_9FUNG|nr:molybdopterin synthase catalytic subunit-like protein [Dimargaris cristalligena]|eukprot:RKP38138.1 molybdopterin synthase catalytic subunit-like protein [Dimargaris cristalligena]